MAQSVTGYKHILLPIDFSDHCTAAGMHAAFLAQQSGGTVHLAHVVENPLEVHDLHATLLQLLGLDHEKLVYRHQGRDYRLTDVFGRVVTEILA